MNAVKRFLCATVVVMSTLSFGDVVPGAVADAVASRCHDFAEMASPSVVVPGLKEGLIPQGLTHMSDRNWFLFSECYPRTKKTKMRPSIVFAVDANSGKVVKQVRLKNSDGTDYTGHAGGIATTAEFIVISSENKLHCFPIAKFLDAANGASIAFVREIDMPNRASYCFCDDGVFWVGEFRDVKRFGKDFETDQTHHRSFRGEEFHSWLCGYVLKNGDLPVDESGKLPPPDFILETPDRVQGASVAAGIVWLSISRGNENDSELVAFDSPIENTPDGHFKIGKTEVPAWFLGKKRRVFSVKAPPMSENLCRVGNDIFVVFESGAKEYQSGKRTCPIDRLFRFPNETARSKTNNNVRTTIRVDKIGSQP